MTTYSLGDRKPTFSTDDWFIAPGAQIIGSVHVGHQANIWFNVVARSDNERIIIGNRVNVQDGTVLHADPGFPLTLEDEVCVGHKAMLHGCTIGTGSLIGMNATMLNGSVIGKHSIVGAGALIAEKKVFPERVLILGTPGRVVREITDAEVAWIAQIADGYVKRAARYKTELKPLD